MIQNVVTNDKYVGSSRDVRHRRNQHFSELRNGEHENKRLQKAFDKYGDNSFVFVTLEEVENKNDLCLREQYWLDKLKPTYNILLTANNNSVTRTDALLEKYKRHAKKMRGKKATKEHKQKIRQGLLEHYSDPANRAKLKKTPEQIEEIRKRNSGSGNGNWGKKRPKEFKDLISNLFSSVQYTFTSPSGEDITFTNLSGNGERLTGLKYWQLRKLYQGEREEYNGWKFKEKIFLGYKK